MSNTISIPSIIHTTVAQYYKSTYIIQLCAFQDVYIYVFNNSKIFKAK